MRILGVAALLGVLGVGVVLWQGGSFSSLGRPSSEDLTLEFRSFATKVRGLKRLGVAELTQMERFELASEARLLDRIPLPTIIVGAQAPVTYSYYVDLESPWAFEMEGNVLRVGVPDLRFGPPALDLAAMQLEVKKGSVLRNHQKAKEELLRAMGEVLESRGQENQQLVLEVSRKKVGEFVRGFVVERFSDLAPGDKLQVQVLFENEQGKVSP